MKTIETVLFMTLIMMSGRGVTAQSSVVRKNPALDAIVAENAEVKKAADGFQFTEGPVWSPQGFLLFSDIPANRIYQWTPEQGASLFMENSGGSNGLAFDHMGNLLACQHTARQIGRMTQDKKFETVTGDWGGKKFNSPNDLAIKSDGSVYFTDPAYGLPLGASDPAKEIRFQGVFRYANGKTELLDSTLDNPNGIAFSPDEKYLYAANYDNDTKAKQWVVYKVEKNGGISKRKVFADATASLEKGGPDGMKVDLAGNVFCAGPGGVQIYSPKGELLGWIRIPEVVANLCFGGKDGKTLFVTARTGLYTVQLNTPAIIIHK